MRISFSVRSTRGNDAGKCENRIRMELTFQTHKQLQSPESRTNLIVHNPSARDDARDLQASSSFHYGVR